MGNWNHSGMLAAVKTKLWVWVRMVSLISASVLLLAGCSSTAIRPKNSPEPANSSRPTNRLSAPQPESSTPVPEPNLEAERTALLEADLTFSRTSEEKGSAQAFYEFLAPDAVSLSAGEPPIRGRDAIKVHLSTAPQGFLTWQPTAAEVAKSGDLGYTWGTAIFQGKGADEKPRITHSKYVSIWKKQNNGRWKVIIFSTSPSPAPAERRQGDHR